MNKLTRFTLLSGAFCTLGLRALTAQTPAAPAPATSIPPAATPSPEVITPDNRNYSPNLSFQTSWEDYLATKKDKPVDVIFIGDSITEQWRWGPGKSVWQKFYADRALDFGKGGDRTQHVLWRLENLDIKSFKPKVAVIMIGTNNTPNTPEDIAVGVKAVIAKTQGMFAGVKVVLASILPNQRAGEKMTAVNAIIRTFADDKSVFYLDLIPSFPAEGENWKGLSRDRLHLSTAGYEAWAEALNPLLAKLGVPIAAAKAQ